MAKQKPGTGLEMSPVEQWKGRIHIGLKAQKPWLEIWDRSLAMYKYETLPTEVKGKKVTVNLAYAYVRSLIPSLYFRDPWITTNPKRLQDVLPAKILEPAINYEWGHLKAKQTIKRVIFDAVTQGYGLVKYGYLPTISQTKDGPMATGDELFLRRVRPRDLIWDPQAETLDSARWVGQRVIRDLKAVQQDPLYAKSVTATLKGTLTLDAKLVPVGMSGEQVAAHSQQVELWELCDLDTHRVLTVCEEADELLRDDPWPVITDGVPFAQLSFNETPDSPYALPDLIYAEDQFRVISALRTAQVSHVKKFVRMLLAQKGQIKQEEQEKMAEAQDGAIIEVTNIEKVKPLDYISYGPDMDKTNDSNKTDLREVLGQSEIARGGVLEERRTLGEVQMIARGGQTRIDERVDVVEDFCEKIAQNLVVIMKQKFSSERMVRITGMQGLIWPPPDFPQALTRKLGVSKTGFAYTKDDILGNFDVEIRAGSSLPLNKEGELKRISVLRELIKEDPTFWTWEGKREVYGELFRLLDIKSPERILPSAPPPAAGIGGGPPGLGGAGPGVPPANPLAALLGGAGLPPHG